MASSSEGSDLLELCGGRIKQFANSKLKYRSAKLQEGQCNAAVLVPLFVKNGTIHLLLTLRSKHLTTHKGQVAFPGGKQDDDDSDIVATALREANEEIGLPSEIVEIVTVLNPVVTRARKDIIHVYPVVGILKSDFEVVMNPSEVEATFDVPLDFFLTKANHTYAKGSYKGYNYSLHCYDYTPTERGNPTKPSNFYIWGLTGGICVEIAAVALNKLPEFEPREEDSELIQYLKESNAQGRGFKVLSGL